VSRLGILIIATMLAAALSGCVRTGTARVTLTPELYDDPFPLRKPGVIIRTARPQKMYESGLDRREAFYRVAKTDTLVSIAEEFYGDRAMGWAIQERNREALREAGGLKRGMVIVLPVAPAAS
jgi:hypothetical protein